MKVYKPTRKALVSGAFGSDDDRIVFLGDGSAALFNKGVLIQSDVLYGRPDSHCVETDESVPVELVTSSQELRHIDKHGIKLPFKVSLQLSPQGV